MMTNVQPVLASLQAWASADMPDDTLLLRDLPARGILTARLQDNGEDGVSKRRLVAFDIKGPRDSGTKTRLMYPAHFAIVRLLAATPGVQLWMASGGTASDATERRFYMRVSISGRRTTLTRIIFKVPTNVDVAQREGADHHLILPETYRLTSPSLTRADVMAQVKLALGWDAHALLKRLFQIADERHGDELTQ